MSVSSQLNYCHILNFPEELRIQIFSSLTNKELQTARKVCSQWNASIISMVLKREWTLLNRIVKHVKIPLPIAFENSTLNEIPKMLAAFRKNAIHYLSQVPKSDLLKLEEGFTSQSLPLFCRNIFYLGLIEAKALEARDLKGLKKNLHLSALCRDLIHKGELSAAVELTAMITNLLLKGIVMELITTSMLEKKQPEWACNVADSIPHRDSKRKALKSITVFYEQRGDYLKASMVKNKMPEDAEEDLLSFLDRIHGTPSLHPTKRLRKNEP